MPDTSDPNIETAAPEACAAAIVADDSGHILLIRRGQPPSEGSWSVPGGRCLAGESAEAACVRETAEETGLDVVPERFAGRVERAAPGGGVYVIDDYVCRLVGGSLHAGDDAADARWVAMSELGDYELTPGLLDCLVEWGVVDG